MIKNATAVATSEQQKKQMEDEMGGLDCTKYKGGEKDEEVVKWIMSRGDRGE